MPIGQKIRQIREQKGLSQGDVEKVSGLLRCYISRVEHGHIVPSLDTLERFSIALGVSLHQLFRESREGGPAPNPMPPKNGKKPAGGAPTNGNGSEDRYLLMLKGLTSRMGESERDLFLDFAGRLANR